VQYECSPDDDDDYDELMMIIIITGLIIIPVIMLLNAILNGRLKFTRSLSFLLPIA